MWPAAYCIGSIDPTRAAGARAMPSALRDVAVRVTEVETASAMTVIDLHVVERPRSAAIGETLGAHALEDPVEVGLIDLERVMVALELRIVVEIEGQRVVDPQRSEVRERTLVVQTKDAGEESGGCLLVVRRHDRMVEHNGHRHLQRLVVSPHMGPCIADFKGSGA